MAACGAAGHPASSAPAPARQTYQQPAPLPPRAELSELEALERDLGASEAQLDRELARQRQAPLDATAASAPPAPEPQAESADEARPQVAPRPGSAAPRPSRPSREQASPKGEGAVENPCDLSCRALGSMRRAKTRICELTGPGERCTRATARVQAAAERVSEAGCHCEASKD